MRWTRLTVWNGGDFIVPIKVEQLNVNSFLDTYNSNNEKTGMNEMKMNDYEMSVRWSNRARLMPETSIQMKPIRVQTMEEMKNEKDES